MLAGVGTALVWVSVRRDLVPDRPAATARQCDPLAETDRALVILAPVYGICYAFLLTLLAFDLIMSLSPHWFSALFGAYYFMGSFYTGLAAVMLLGVIASRRMGLGSVIGRPQFHDLGKLIFAFCVVTADFFFTQFLVQWYGNLPEETEFIIHRIYYAPWETVAWTVLIVCFAVPFVLLLSRKLKMMPTFMFALCTVILAGMWLERFFLVSPSIWKEHELPLGVSEVLITAGFFGAAALCTLLFLRRFPALPLADPFFRSLTDPHGGGGMIEPKPPGTESKTTMTDPKRISRAQRRKWHLWFGVMAAGDRGHALLLLLPSRTTGIGPAQPIPFSHRVHAGVKAIDCRFCHPFVERSENAGLPEVEKCFYCHEYIIPIHPEILKEKRYYTSGTPGALGADLLRPGFRQILAPAAHPLGQARLRRVPRQRARAWTA